MKAFLCLEHVYLDGDVRQKKIELSLLFSFWFFSPSVDGELKARDVQVVLLRL